MLERCRTTNPVWCVAFAFAVSTAAARWVSHVNPAFHYNIHGIHIHHYMYGIFMITVAGYCGLVFKSPKATFWIALLFGWGAGFARFLREPRRGRDQKKSKHAQSAGPRDAFSQDRHLSLAILYRRAQGAR